MLFFLIALLYNKNTMKLFNGKDEPLYLSKQQWTKLFVAMSILTILLYTGAMIASLCGSKYFILNYQNYQMDRIENFLTQYNLLDAFNYLFSVIEFSIILAFITKRVPKWYYILSFYVVAVIFYYTLHVNQTFFNIYPFIFYLTVPIIEQLKDNHKSLYHEKFSFKKYLFCLLRMAIAVAITLILQAMILVIKSGSFNGQNNIQPLSSAFIYAIEYDIALLVVLFSITLLFNREKGDSDLCLNLGGSSQTSKKQSQTSNTKNLSPKQKNKIRLLYCRVYLIQLGAFLLVMILPFLLGKVLEFLAMYLSFAVARYILGFNYSLHYKKETICITVGVIVFGILSLAVPFFYIVLIIAIVFGIALAILLHLSYKYKGFYLFTKVAKPDKFALLYVYFDGDITDIHIKKMCNHKGLDPQQTHIICDFMAGNKISYLAWKYNYSQRNLIYKLDEAIEKLIN